MDSTPEADPQALQLSHVKVQVLDGISLLVPAPDACCVGCASALGEPSSDVPLQLVWQKQQQKHRQSVAWTAGRPAQASCWQGWASCAWGWQSCLAAAAGPGTPLLRTGRCSAARSCVRHAPVVAYCSPGHESGIISSVIASSATSRQRFKPSLAMLGQQVTR